ncbi:hypothetical protein PMAYCL1PPCAC_18200 [Pristionchus mayeri]|uniref:ADP ribosylation factor n=1 Tax=Pristionchus mayeri TaxID=1317129 RepID=A0AAN5CP40_9BILA|nr:hypothetical protein PMAYCL1PPCAC_18200 [Pristionchus mayeri]
MDQSEKDRLLKVVVCGDGASGKTSLCLRFAHETFDAAYHQTLGLDFFRARIILPGDVGVTLQVWDVGGQSIASSMINNYVSGADAVLIVYDITNKTSLEGAREWIESVKKIMKDSQVLPVLALVGNKSDLDDKRQVRVEAHNRFAEEEDLRPFYVSARTDGGSVSLLFKQIAAQVMKIPMPKAELDKEIVPMPAEATFTQDLPKRTPRVPGQNNTTVCSVM